MTDRSIIHLNIADFAVAIERLIDGRLRHRPVIIAAEGTARATVYDMSEEAYRCGVRKGMALRKATRFCRDTRVLPPHPDRYDRAMDALLRQALPVSPLIETGERDGHLFVDVTGTSRLFGPSVDVAWRLQKQVKAALGLDPIWSVATNKLVAKVASRLVKPSGEYVVGAGEEATFLMPLPLYLVPGIERNDLIRLREFNLVRVSHVVALSPADLEVAVGSRAQHVFEAVRGIDAAPVLPFGQKRRAVRSDHTFDDDTNERHELQCVLHRMAAAVCEALRRRCLAAHGIEVVLDYSDGVRCVRRGVVEPPTAHDRALFDAAARTLSAAWNRRVRIRICVSPATE